MSNQAFCPALTLVFSSSCEDLWNFETNLGPLQWQFLLRWSMCSAHLYLKIACSSNKHSKAAANLHYPYSTQKNVFPYLFWKVLRVTTAISISQLATLDSAMALWVNSLPDLVQRLTWYPESGASVKMHILFKLFIKIPKPQKSALLQCLSFLMF